VEHRHVYLPAGSWHHLWSGSRIDGPAHVLAHAPLGQPAVYARSNTPIPLWPPLQHTGQTPDSLTWRVFVSPGSGMGSLYEDSGDGYGPSCRRTAHVGSGEDGLVRFSLSARAGSYVPPPRVLGVQLGSEVVEVEESAEPVVIERLVDL
jgi:alpha-glucosidase